jgi:hypothetical protein
MKAGRWRGWEGLAKQVLTGPPSAGGSRPDVQAAAEAAEPVPHFPFLDGDIAAVAGYTLDHLDDKHRVPSGPWSTG